MTRLGEYEIVGPLGSGGMSTIQLARALDGTLVVLKRQLREADDPYLIDEGNLGLRLTHPGLVQTRELFDVDGRPVLVLTYVPGVSLASLSENGPLPPGVVCDLGAQVAEALDALHNATDARGNPLNIVHRDVTPNNILIGFDGHARLIDFGIARYVNSQAPQTQVGQLRGTLHYLAPEVVSGSIHSRASDLWSLGVSLFEAAVGRVAVERNDIHAVMDAITNQRVLALRPGETLDPRILHALAQLVNPEARCRPAMAGDAAVLLQLRADEQENARAETVARVSTLLGQPAQTHLSDSGDDEAKTAVLHQAELLFGPSYSGEEADDDPFLGIPDAPSHNPFAKAPATPPAASLDPFAAAAPGAAPNHRVPTPPPFAAPVEPRAAAAAAPVADPFSVGAPQRSNTGDPFAVPTPPPLDLATVEPAPVPAPPPSPEAFATMDPFDAFDPLSSAAALKNDPFATPPPPEESSWDPFADAPSHPAVGQEPLVEGGLVQPAAKPAAPPSVAASFGDSGPRAAASVEPAPSASAYPGLQQIDDDDPDRTHALVLNPSGPNPASMPADMPELDLDDETERNPPEAPNPVSMLAPERPSTTTEPPDPTAISPRPISAIDDAHLPDAPGSPEDSLPSRNEFDVMEKTNAAHPAIVQDLALKSTMVKSDEGPSIIDEIPHVEAPGGDPALPTVVGENVPSAAPSVPPADDGGFGGDIKTRVEDEQLPSLLDSRQGPVDKGASLNPFPESGPSEPAPAAPPPPAPPPAAPTPPTPVTSGPRMPPPPPVTDPERAAYVPEGAPPPAADVPVPPAGETFTPDGFAAAAASTPPPSLSPMVPPKTPPVAETSGRPNLLLVAAAFGGIALAAFVVGWALAQLG